MELPVAVKSAGVGVNMSSGCPLLLAALIAFIEAVSVLAVEFADSAGETTFSYGNANLSVLLGSVMAMGTFWVSTSSCT
jgi:hypothetical protein